MLTLALRCDASAPSNARRAVDVTLTDEPAGGDVRLVVSELVSNAVRHSGAGRGDVLRLCIRLSDELVEILVRDTGQSGDAPHIRPREGTSPGGLGLRIVERLALRWGSETPPRAGRVVWARIPRGPTSLPRRPAVASAPTDSGS